MRKLLVPVCFMLPVAIADVAWAAPCMPRVKTFHGQTVDGYMSVRSGGRCNIRFQSAGPTETTQITQRPSNGTATAGGAGRITYQARAGYVGSDTFTYQRRGQDKLGGASVKTVRVNVTVRP